MVRSWGKEMEQQGCCTSRNAILRVRNISVHTQLDSNVFNSMSGETFWPHRPDVVIIRVCAIIMVLVGRHAIAKLGLTDAG
jgi:hypothetical protein